MNNELSEQVVDGLRIILQVDQGETLTDAAMKVRYERDTYMQEVARLRLRDLAMRAALSAIRIGVDEGSMSSVDIRVKIDAALGTRNTHAD